MFKFKYKKEADIEVLGFNHSLYYIDMHYVSTLDEFFKDQSLMSINKKRNRVQCRVWAIQDTEHLVNSGKIRRDNG